MIIRPNYFPSLHSFGSLYYYPIIGSHLTEHLIHTPLHIRLHIHNVGILYPLSHVVSPALSSSFWNTVGLWRENNRVCGCAVF